MKKLIILMLLVSSVAYATDRPKGESKLCDDIGYLSTSCKDVEVLPFEYKDKSVAKIAAGATKVEENQVIVINEKPDAEEIEEQIIIKTWWTVDDE